jgi:hypothetical protein
MLGNATVPATCNVVAGVFVPIPNQLLASSQKKFAFSWLNAPPVPAKITDPGVNPLTVTVLKSPLTPYTFRRRKLLDPRSCVLSSRPPTSRTTSSARLTPAGM